MILSIAFKDFYHNFISARFIIGFILCLILIPFTVVVGIQEYKSRQQIYEVEKKEADESMQVRVYSALRPVVVKPPEPLSIFSRGISYNVGNRVQIFLSIKPLLAEGRVSVRDNPFLNSLFTLDFCTVLGIIMSFLALVFSYDVCSREREQGTLKLMLSNSVSRAKFLLGKVLGVFMTLLPIILFCYILSCIIVLVYPGISFTAQDWSRIIMLLMVSIVYFSLFIALGVFISSRLRSSITSIILCLFVWITMVFIIPSFAVYATRSFMKVRSRENLDFVLQEIEREEYERIRESSEELDRSNIWFMHFNHNGGYDGYRELKGAAIKTYEFYRQQNEKNEPLRIVIADKRWPVQRAYLDELERQRIFSEKLAVLSPSEVFRLAASSLCRTDADAQNNFLDKTRLYREELISFFNDEKIFSSFAYFTPLSPDTFMDKDELVRFTTDNKFQSVEEFNTWATGRSDAFSVFVKRKPEWDVQASLIDISNVPQFSWQPDKLFDSLRKSIGRLGIMAIISILLFYLSFVSFTRYDVR